jgi:peptidoglycan glycosyltransferase
MALVAAGVANEGEIMRPYLVASVSESDGATLRETPPSSWRRGAGPEAARQTAALMITAVENGALGNAFVPGYTIGGKTGTAETGSGEPHAWFIGFIGLPDEEPRYAVAVILEAGGGGGQVALPIGRDLLVAAMGYSPSTSSSVASAPTPAWTTSPRSVAASASGIGAGTSTRGA